ncbi:lysoplasmalogenase [Lutimonas zeaxanthinifaciens]|uniref:lysoplasmalogenase n=1 Tax=Lutimonas zeaxanthinifaciens TaxID=3060215 RepID=UPI00265D5962|nr:lysoplasmalogenase [Lutimonas sp. YSD2104]WKK65004.1 lysoplasmalogenase [Lutimonas sp. YSD2104]
MISTRPTSRIFLAIFILVSVADILAVLFKNLYWQTLFKPLIIPSLIAFYLSVSEIKNKFFLLALFFSFLGDVLLLDKSNLFLYGIAAFLLTQLIYIFIFSKGLNKSVRGIRLKASVPFMIFYMVLIWILYPGLGSFLVPVLVYGFAISVFGVVSLLNYLIRDKELARYLLAGAILFIISDSMIALNKFHLERSFYAPLIMITYISAQYLIVRFMLKLEKAS